MKNKKKKKICEYVEEKVENDFEKFSKEQKFLSKMEVNKNKNMLNLKHNLNSTVELISDISKVWIAKKIKEI